MPNKLSQPTTPSVTPPAGQEARQPQVATGLQPFGQNILMTTDQSSSSSCVEVTVTHNRLAFFYELFTPTIDIDGAKERKPWGTWSFNLPPGDHEVAVSYPWIISECGRNSVRLSLAVGETKKVRYCAGLIRFLPGSIKVTS